MNNRVLLTGSILISATLLAIVIWMLASPSESGLTPEREAEILGSSEDPTRGVPAGGGGAEPFLNLDDPEEELEYYLKWAQYPPHSRPLHSGQRDLTDPYNAERPPLTVLASPAEDCRPAAADGEAPECERVAVFADFECDLKPQRSISVGRADQLVYLSCRSSKNGVRIAASGFESKVYIKDGRKLRSSLPPVAGGDNGADGDESAGDLIYTFAIRPGAKDWGPMYFEVEFDVAGHRHVQRCSWFSTPHTVAEFRPGARDGIQDGHLVVKVPVNVRKAGYYVFDANLQREGGDREFIASAIWEGELQAGPQLVRYEFFGKIIRDSDLDGPYVVRDIRGMRDNGPVSPAEMERSLASGEPVEPREQTEPMREYIEPLKETHVTRGYSATEFSNAEWQSQQKENRIRFLRSQIQR